MSAKKRFSIVIDGIDEDKWNQCVQRFQKDIFLNLPETIAIHFDKLSLIEQLLIIEAMGHAVGVFHHQLIKKQTGGN